LAPSNSGACCRIKLVKVKVDILEQTRWAISLSTLRGGDTLMPFKLQQPVAKFRKA
jgi:hypothetical protein